jgi:DNA-binding MarR family transcriptional regulator
VKRSTSALDKRETVINLTQSGLDVLEESTQRMDQMFNRLLTLTDSESLQLNDLLERLRTNE